MNTPLKRIFTITILSFLAAAAALAQNTSAETLPAPSDSRTDGIMDYSEDLEGRAGVSFKFKLYKGLSLSLANEARMKDHITRFDRNHLSGGLSYKVCDYFSVAAVYTLMSYLRGEVGDHYWDQAHRVHVDLKGQIKLGNWQIYLRERPFVNLHPGEDGTTQTWQLRSKLNFQYSIPKTPVTPNIHFEAFNTLNAPKEVGQYLERMRFAFGLNFKIDSKNALNLYYYFDIRNKKFIDADPTRKYGHIIGVAYKFAM